MLFVFYVFETFLLVDQECVLFSSNQLGFKAIDCNLLNNDLSVCFSPAEQGSHYSDCQFFDPVHAFLLVLKETYVMVRLLRPCFALATSELCYYYLLAPF